jgi:hypothetical protein
MSAGRCTVKSFRTECHAAWPFCSSPKFAKRPARRSTRAGIGLSKDYCFFSGIAGVAGCEPPVDFGPGVTPALFSVDPLESLAAVESEFGFAPFVGPLPAPFVDVVPFVGPLPASAFGCAKADAEKPIAIIEMSKLLLNEDIEPEPPF